MKPTLTRWIRSSINIIAFAVAFAFLTSCAEDALSANNRAQGVEALPADQTPDTFSALTGCPDVLVNDGCNFTTGTGRVSKLF